MPVKTLLASAALVLAAAPVLAQEQPTYSASYANDRAEIEDLTARYLFAIDYHDWDAYVATFAEDGELEFAVGVTKGREAIRATVTDFAAGIGKYYHTEDGRPAKLRHVVLQNAIRVEGDRAWGRILWVEMANDGPGDSMKMGTYGLYEDDYRKIDGRWLIQRRNVLNEFIDSRNSGPENPVAEMDAAADAYAESVAALP
ncbi:nuclear transport factor 2 family protein [Aurantiacibacter suaedae]|uniref:nuclear transport factor 2 family protein n=1 Tax=Aurantiacibacter suaedae TaxID=2545755 RepID=UPI0010F83F95|nr:nuclear transport factor 2 family protein [Aurantiacibacter suaedae]